MTTDTEKTEKPKKCGKFATILSVFNLLALGGLSYFAYSQYQSDQNIIKKHIYSFLPSDIRDAKLNNETFISQFKRFDGLKHQFDIETLKFNNMKELILLDFMPYGLESETSPLYKFLVLHASKDYLTESGKFFYYYLQQNRQIDRKFLMRLKASEDNIDNQREILAKALLGEILSKECADYPAAYWDYQGKKAPICSTPEENLIHIWNDWSKEAARHYRSKSADYSKEINFKQSIIN